MSLGESPMIELVLTSAIDPMGLDPQRARDSHDEALQGVLVTWHYHMSQKDDRHAYLASGIEATMKPLKVCS